jgi:hypothetical protein
VKGIPLDLEGFGAPRNLGLPLAMQPQRPPQPPPASDVPRANALVSTIKRLDARLDETVWDIGQAISELMKLKEVFGAKDIKELVRKAALPMSHMTAQKYLLVARVFPRDVALEQGIEKCYALMRLAVLLGRRRVEALAMLQNDEVVAPGVRAKAAQAQQVRARIAALKAEREAQEEAQRVPAAERAKHERAAEEAKGILRSLGVKGAKASVEHARSGAATIVVRFPLATALALPDAVPHAIARYGKQLMRREPAKAAPLARAGWAGTTARQGGHERRRAR